MSVERKQDLVDDVLTGHDETFGLREDQEQSVPFGIDAGADIGGATIVRQLAAGGMGQVYEARQHAPTRRVAVKFLRGYGDSAARRRLLEEAVLLARVKHVNIAHVYTVGNYRLHGQTYQWIMMELVENACSISEYAKRMNLSLVQRGRLVLNAIEAIAAAHSKGIIHLDIKSTNILVAGDGSVKVIDFGIGRTLTELHNNEHVVGEIRGTPACMSPEQRAGLDERIDARSDIYGMGLLCTELFTENSRVRVSKQSNAGISEGGMHDVALCKETLLQQGTKNISRAAVEDLCAVLARCVEPCPDSRFSTMVEVRNELIRWLDGKPVVCRQPSSFEVSCRFIARQKVVAACVLLFIATLISAGCAVGWFAISAVASQQEAIEAANVAHGTLAGSLLRQAFSAEREHHIRLSRDLLSQRDDVLVRLDGQVPLAVVESKSLAIRALRAQLDEACSVWHSQGESITAVAVNSTADMALTASQDGRLCVFTVESGHLNQLPNFCYEAGSRPWTVALCADGQVAVVGCDNGTIHVVDVKTGEAIGICSDSKGPVYGVVALPSEGGFLSAGRDGVLRQWPLRGPFEPTVLASFKTTVYGIDQSQDGMKIAIGLRDSTVRVWHRKTGRQQVLHGHEQRVFSVSFSDDGQSVASASEDQTVRIWNLEASTEQACLHHPTRVNAVHFSGIDQVASATADQVLRIWNLNSTRPPRSLHGHEGDIWSLDFFGRNRLVTGSADGTVRLWRDAADAQPRFTIDARVRTTSLSPDGRFLAAGTSLGMVRVWDTKEGRACVDQKISTSSINNICWHPQCAEIAVAGSDGTVSLWTFDDIFDSQKEKYDLHAVANFQHDETMTKHRRRVFSVSYAKSGDVLASAGEDGSARLWHRGKNEQGSIIRHPGRVFCVAFSADGENPILATGCEDGVVRVFNSSGTLIQSFDEHQGQVNAIVWNQNAELSWNLASASADGTVRLWRLPEVLWEGEPFLAESLAVLQSGGTKIWSLDSVPDEPLLIAGTENGKVILWSGGAAMPLGTLDGHHAPVWSVSVGPAGSQLWTGGWDGTVRRWDVSNAEWMQSGYAVHR
ncbi:MAG: protein kinase [Planctomycetaceae bacterium]|nr:protein kinase [Planctomycetaceae bacterium]